MGNFYIMKNKVPVRVEDEQEWRNWFVAADHRIALDELGGAIVSTVFLGIDEADGMLFETMVFNGPLPPYRQCYRTCAEAEHRHQEIVAEITQALAGETAVPPPMGR